MEAAAGTDALPLVCRSNAMRGVVQTLEQLARDDRSVLIHGESGVGMGFVSRHIHQTSRRREHPLVEVPCAAIPESAFPDMLFGTDPQGAYFSASRGTLLISTFGELPASLQRKLMSGVSGGSPPADAPRIVATHFGDPADPIDDYGIPDDVLKQFSVVAFPPLRERGADITALTELFLRMVVEREACEMPPLTSAELKRIEHCAWPGNVRELWIFIEIGISRWREGHPFTVVPDRGE